MKSNSMKIVTLLCIIIGILAKKTVHFTHATQCIQTSEHQCEKWDTKVQFTSQQQLTGYGCFSEQQFVVTPQGPVSFRDLRIGDKILGFDFNTGRAHYTQIITWLKRDPNSQLQYLQIQTDNYTYSVSPSHNIAYQEQGKIGFKLAQNLTQNDYLISLGRKNLIIKSTSSLDFERGIYSPYTELGNFYILPKNTQNTEAPLILVHCLSQVQNPQKIQENWLHWLMNSQIVSLSGINEHDQESQQDYQHPVTHLLRNIDGYHTKQIMMKHDRYGGGNDDHQQRKRRILSIILQMMFMSKAYQQVY